MRVQGAPSRWKRVWGASLPACSWVKQFLGSPRITCSAFVLLVLTALVTVDIYTHGENWSTCVREKVKHSIQLNFEQQDTSLSNSGSPPLGPARSTASQCRSWLSTSWHRFARSPASPPGALSPSAVRGEFPPALAPGQQLDLECFVINLTRNFHRLQTFRRRFAASDMASYGCTRQAAVDGRLLDRGKLWSILTHQAWVQMDQARVWDFRLKHYEITKGGVGCYLSHMAVWRRFLRTSNATHLVVFEDDALVDRQMLTKLQQQLAGGMLPPDFDILLLGCMCNNCTDRGTYRQVHHFWGTHAYLATRDAVERLLDLSTYQGTNLPGLLPIAQQIDAVLVDLSRHGQVSIVAVGTSDARNLVKVQARASDIQLDVKQWWGVDSFEPVQAPPSVLGRTSLAPLSRVLL